ncbi:hypothetical protein ABIF66_003984 [Bradyrhizobium japonicum]
MIAGLRKRTMTSVNGGRKTGSTKPNLEAAYQRSSSAISNRERCPKAANQRLKKRARFKNGDCRSPSTASGPRRPYASSNSDCVSKLVPTFLGT